MSRWSLYREVRHQLRQSGFGQEQASDAAKIADRVLRKQRNECIRACFRSGMKIRAIARVWGISAAMAHNICGEVFSDEGEIEHPQSPPLP